jgi:acyl-CoA reductase-like NAD-dependent aldehyde dehydrogenase
MSAPPSASIPVRDPRTGAIDAQIAPPSPRQLDAACQRLRARQGAWAGLTIAQRAEHLLALRAAIETHRDEIAAALERDTGRRAIARDEVAGVLGALSGWAAQAPHLLREETVSARTMQNVTHAPQHVPYALVGVVSPWNFPLTLSLIDAIPALLAGCAVLVKPSEVTPRFMAPFMRAVAAVPAIDAVFAMVAGDGRTGAALIERVDAVCFTGSVATGRKVAVQCAERLIPAFLELGGKDPLVVLESADLEHAVAAALRGSVLATGQACQSIERIYVARALHERFVDRLVQAARACRFNWPDISKGEIGPIIFARQADILRDQLDDAVAKGAHIETGGRIETHGGGLWLAPTVVTNVTHEMRLMREETFGPIMPISAFDTPEEAVALANDSDFGLSAAVIAGTAEEAEAIARRIDAGAVSVNDAAMTAFFYEAEKMSFKQSGLGGSRMGAAGFFRFLRKKALIVNHGAPRPLSSFAEDRQG